MTNGEATADVTTIGVTATNSAATGRSARAKPAR
jgi:hypothetical protein